MRVSRNWVLEVGVWLIVGAVLVWIGAELSRRIEWVLPWVGGFGVVFLIVGVGMEIWKRRKRPAGISPSART
jgi:protein-S-isoprenylcysteine O-methyltransferase Ste14